MRAARSPEQGMAAEKADLPMAVNLRHALPSRPSAKPPYFLFNDFIHANQSSIEAG
jgi:hypothetical protein